MRGHDERVHHRCRLLGHHHRQAAAEYGVAYDQFELSDDVGGNWYFRNPNGRSAVYESLHIDTSKTRLQFEDYPVPEEWPDFPSHRLMHDYFRATSRSSACATGSSSRPAWSGPYAATAAGT